MQRFRKEGLDIAPFDDSMPFVFTHLDLHPGIEGTCDGLVSMAPCSSTGSESSQAATDKLRLACALFRGSIRGRFTHPEAPCVITYYVYPRWDECELEHTGSFWDRYAIEYIAEASSMHAGWIQMWPRRMM